MRKLAVFLAASTALAATPSLARDGQPYFGFEGGAVLAEDISPDIDTNLNGEFDLEDAIDVEHDLGFELAVFAGYDLGAFRLEGEVAYKRAGLKSAEVNSALVVFDPGDPLQTSFDDLDGRTEILSTMANAMLDIGPDDGAQFFVGGGAGYAWVDLNGGLAGDPLLINDKDSEIGRAHV